jgi:hypothetical protein
MGRKIKVWVEVMTVQTMTETLIDVPDGWDDMSAQEQDSYMNDCFEDERNNVANGGYELVED